MHHQITSQYQNQKNNDQCQQYFRQDMRFFLCSVFHMCSFPFPHVSSACMQCRQNSHHLSLSKTGTAADQDNLLPELSKTISRVMSWMIIYLDQMSPSDSSDLPESQRATVCFLFGLASDGVYICLLCYQRSGGLLHRHSTLTSASTGGIFLLHFPWSRLRRTLSGILPCEARTFLDISRDHPSHSC